MQHPVRAHLGQLVLQLHGLIEQAAGIEELFQRQSAAPVPCGQLVVSRVFQLDVAEIVGNVVFVQPFSRFLAGGAFGIADKGHGSRSCSNRNRSRFVQAASLQEQVGGADGSFPDHQKLAEGVLS